MQFIEVTFMIETIGTVHTVISCASDRTIAITTFFSFIVYFIHYVPLL